MRFAFFIFAVFVMFGILFSRCDGVSTPASPSLFNQFKRRLFDQDVPEDPKTKNKQHDMTGI